MTKPEKREAQQLADACAGDWEAVRPHLVVQMLRDQDARVVELEAERVTEAARTAEATLRANQAEDQHRMSRNMHAADYQKLQGYVGALTAAEARIAELEAEKTHPYKVGDLTAAEVFKAAGLQNMSDMQAVLDAVEDALESGVELQRQALAHLRSTLSCPGDAAGPAYTVQFGKALAAPPAPAGVAVPDGLGQIRVGRLPTMNQDDYPGLGDWWVQLRIGNEGDEVLARVYGSSPEQAHARAAALAAPQAQADAPDLQPPTGIRNDRDMLNYLMGAFDCEVHYCERCGHDEPTKDMDSASLLRDYLAAAPAQALAQSAQQQQQQQSAEITDAEIDRIAQSMPGGLDGFLKAWGWRQFARAILQAAPPATASAAVSAWIEALAESWDGCMYDAPGETIDVGASIRRAALAAAPAQAVAVPAQDWRVSTTYLARFGDAIALLCHGNRPPDSMLTEWLDGSSEDLQGFAAQNGPAWAQGIGLIDAATLAADQPTEGPDHEMREVPSQEHATQLAGRHPIDALPVGHLYGEVNNLLTHIGMEGSIDADHAFVHSTMAALAAIDGGVYLDNLNLAHLPTPATQGLAQDVCNALAMLQAGEWAEHFAKTELGKQLESAITDLHSELNDAAAPIQAQEDARDASEMALRRMLCITYSRGLAYMDGGEMQDSQRRPAIDFKRDTAKEIEKKITARNVEAMVAPLQKVLMEHSGCGSKTQVDQLTVRLNPGDKVVLHKGRTTQAFDRADAARAAQGGAA